MLKKQSVKLVRLGFYAGKLVLRLAAVLGTLLLLLQLAQYRCNAESFAKNGKEILKVILSQTNKYSSIDVMFPQLIQGSILNFTRQMIAKLFSSVSSDDSHLFHCSNLTQRIVDSHVDCTSIVHVRIIHTFKTSDIMHCKDVL